MKRGNPLLSCACLTPQKETTASQASFEAINFGFVCIVIYTPVFMDLAIKCY